MHEFSDFIHDLTIFGLALFFPVAIIMIYLKRRRARRIQQYQSDGPLMETAADLERAEEDLQQMPIDIREKLIETHDLYDRFPSHRGYSSSYMEAFTKRLREAGIDCDVVFQATLPMGVADAIVEPQGIYELYVLRSHKLEAKNLIPNLLETTKAE